MRTLTVILFFCLFSISLFSKGYKIEITINGAANDTILLAYYHGEGRYAKDTAYADAEGYAVFSKATPLPGGLYMMIKKGMILFDFLISDDDSQQFSIHAENSDIFGSLKFTNSPENTKFHDTQLLMGEWQRQSMRLREKAYADKSFEPLAQDSLEKIDKEMQVYAATIAGQFPKKLIASLVMAMKGAPAVPEMNIPENIPDRDSLIWAHHYQFNKEHYFDNIDFSDKRLLNTPVLQANLDYYFTKVLLQVPDSIIPQVEWLLEKVKTDRTMFMFCTGHICNMFIKSPIMGMESVVVFMAKKYYLSGQAYWADEEILKQMADFVEYNQYSLIGMPAHELEMQTTSGEYVSLHGLKSPYVVLFFYEINCGYCQQEAPKLLNIYHKYQSRGVAFMAVNVQVDEEEWKTFVKEGKYDWINVWDPQRKSQFPDFYNVSTTPQVYLVDKERKIIARRLDAENLDFLLNNLLNARK